MKRSPSQKSVMKHDFSKIPSVNIARSSFNRSHGLKTTFNSGPLYPMYLDEVLPGDTHSVRMHALARLSTPLHPTMDNLFLETFFFYVPMRIVWANFQKFMGEQDNPGDSIDFTIPVVTTHNTSVGDLADYFGLPIGVSLAANPTSALPFRMYNMIWNQWFRDENLQDSESVASNDGPDNYGLNYGLLSRGKRHDYFTSCLPFPQKGPGVDLPLGTLAPIIGIGLDPAATSANLFQQVNETEQVDVYNVAYPGSDLFVDGDSQGPDTSPLIYADLSSATAATINDLRQAFQIQKLQERDARGGTRYQELVLAHFGVRGGDARLDRPEYLGGGSTPINITQVPQTSADEVGGGADTPQGHLAGYGTASVSGHGFTKSFVEHGYIIGLVNIRADLTYQQGQEKLWARQTKYDFYWPALQALGEQSVLNNEIYSQGTSDDSLTFGYQERWAELRYKNSMITGEFRSAATASLDSWHLSEDFQVLPVLGDTFITSKPPVDRIVAVPAEPQFIMDAYFKVKSVRPMPTYSVPGYIDHF